LWDDYKLKNNKKKDIVYVAQAKCCVFVENDESLTRLGGIRKTARPGFGVGDCVRRGNMI
jgi:hypothetical protein